MANQWFRMYSEFLTDPKVQRLSEADQRRYIMILCMRCNVTSNDDETLHETLSDENVTFMLRISNDEWLKTKLALTSKYLIDDNNNPCAWDMRQYVSDSSSERVRRYREKQKNDVTKCNVSVTPPDTNTESYTDIELDKSNSRAHFKKPTKTDIHNFCEAEKICINADAFLDHYNANGWMVGKSKMKDWKPTVRNWARRELEFKQSRKSVSPSPRERPDYFYEPSNEKLKDMQVITGERIK